MDNSIQNKKKILCVGGAGFIGGKVVDRLIEGGHDVTVFDNLLYEERYLKPINFIYGDIRDTGHLLSIYSEFDYIVWLAALVGDPASAINPELTNEINHLAVKNFCQQSKCKDKMIFFSTCSVYGINDNILNESSQTNPLSVYASTKLAAEKYILDQNGCVFRLGTLFGVGDSYSRIRLDLVVNVMTMKAFMDKKIVVNGGEQWRPIIAVNDVAEYTLRCVNNFNSGIYILGYKNVLIKDLGKEISSLVPYSTIEYNDLPFQDLRNYKVDSSLAEKTFNYAASTTVASEVIKISKVLNERRIKDLTSSVYHNGLYLRNNPPV